MIAWPILLYSCSLFSIPWMRLTFFLWLAWCWNEICMLCKLFVAYFSVMRLNSNFGYTPWVFSYPLPRVSSKTLKYSFWLCHLIPLQTMINAHCFAARTLSSTNERNHICLVTLSRQKNILLRSIVDKRTLQLRKIEKAVYCTLRAPNRYVTLVLLVWFLQLLSNWILNGGNETDTPLQRLITVNKLFEMSALSNTFSQLFVLYSCPS